MTRCCHPRSGGGGCGVKMAIDRLDDLCSLIAKLDKYQFEGDSEFRRCGYSLSAFASRVFVLLRGAPEPRFDTTLYGALQIPCRTGLRYLKT